MSDQDKELRKLVVSEPPTLPHQVRAREIEAEAGMALRREYWLEDVDTPFGVFSRRSLAYTAIGLLLTLIFFLAVFYWRVSTIPDPTEFPETDAFTVMTHIHANFAAPVKDAQFQPFRGDVGANWRNRDAYSFSWRDENGSVQQVVVLSYASLDDILMDYRDHTRPVVTEDRTGSFAYGDKIDVEARSYKNYGSEWVALRMGNILMLITPTAMQKDIQALQSHMVTIVGSAYRDYIPTATP